MNVKEILQEAMKDAKANSDDWYEWKNDHDTVFTITITGDFEKSNDNLYKNVEYIFPILIDGEAKFLRLSNSQLKNLFSLMDKHGIEIGDSFSFSTKRKTKKNNAQILFDIQTDNHNAKICQEDCKKKTQDIEGKATIIENAKPSITPKTVDKRTQLCNEHKKLLLTKDKSKLRFVFERLSQNQSATSIAKQYSARFSLFDYEAEAEVALISEIYDEAA